MVANNKRNNEKWNGERASERERDGKRAQIKQHGKLYENDEPHAQTKEKTTPKYVAKNANKIVSVCRHFGPAYIRDWSACVSFNLRTGKNAPLNAHTHLPQKPSTECIAFMAATNWKKKWYESAKQLKFIGSNLKNFTQILNERCTGAGVVVFISWLCVCVRERARALCAVAGS